MRYLIIFIFVFSFAFKMKKGDYVTADIYDKNQVKWAKKFKIADIGGIDDENINSKMLPNNITLGYDWFPAFYFVLDAKNNNFVKWLYKNRYKTTLNPNGPFLHCKEMNYNWCKDYYYNFGDKKVIDKKITWLIQNMKKRGYKGLFFDWASGIYILENEYKPIYKNFKKLNPNKDYFSQIDLFYKKLKKRGVFFVTNQAFRVPHHLKYISYDMAESFITTDKKVNGKIVTDYYPIDSKTLKSTFEYLNMLSEYRKKYKKYGFKNFILLNYLGAEYKNNKKVKPKNGIYFAYAMAKLFDFIEYSEVDENRSLEQDEIYFYDLGKSLGKYKEIQKGIWIKNYQNGFVLVSKALKNDKIIELKQKYYDLYHKKWIKKIELHHQNIPLGRVYLKE